MVGSARESKVDKVIFTLCPNYLYGPTNLLLKFVIGDKKLILIGSFYHHKHPFHSFIHLLIYSHIHSFIHSLTRSVSQSVSHFITCRVQITNMKSAN